MEQFFQPQDLRAIAPELALTVFGLGLLVLDLIVPDKRKLGYWALAGVASAAILLFLNRNLDAATAYGGQVVVDPFADYFKLMFLLATGLTVGLSMRYLDVEGEQHGEYYALLLFAVMGMMFMAGGADMVTLYIGLETMAIATYVLVGFLRRRPRSNEASIKYFLLGAFSSGVLLYGMSLLYGISGSTNLVEIADALSRRGADPVSLIAMITVSAGMFFKIGAVPFHQWTPDAYEGAPTSVTAFMSVAVKAASFAMLLRIFLIGIGPLREQWVPVLAAVAVTTITLGNIAALRQTNVKRLLAYSSISHAGFVLLGLIAGNRTGMVAVVLYLFIYTFMNLGAWGVVVALRRGNVIGENVEDLNGLYSRNPVAAVAMLIFMLSLAGIPPTAGFIAKYHLFAAVIETGHVNVAVVAALNVAIGLYYYMRLVVAMFMAEPSEAGSVGFSRGVTSVLVITLALTILIGVYPDWFINLAQDATATLPVF